MASAAPSRPARRPGRQTSQTDTTLGAAVSGATPPGDSEHHASRPTPGLDSVSGTSAVNAFASGCCNSGRFPGDVFAQWNGRTWKAVPGPALTSRGTYSARVAGISPTDAWAAVGNDRPIMLHWNGQKWSQVKVPHPGVDSNALAGITALSTSDAWAVGTWYSPPAFRTFILHWNGTAWTRAVSG
jgi:hypothetical protein